MMMSRQWNYQATKNYYFLRLPQKRKKKKIVQLKVKKMIFNDNTTSEEVTEASVGRRNIIFNDLLNFTEH